MDFGFAIGLAVRIEFAELPADLVGFEMDALDFIIGAAAFDGRPVHDGGSGSAKRVAHVGLLKDFFGAGESTAVGEELFRGKAFALGAVDDVQEAELDGIGHGDFEIQIPGTGICISICDF